MANILMIYSSTDGHTLAICRRLRDVVQALGHAVTLVPIDEAPEAELGGYDAIVIGASIRYGRHHPLVAGFIQRHRALLEETPTAFFSVNLVARKPDKNRPETNPYFRRFLKRVGWQPREAAVFAGKLDYPAYGPFDRWVIRLIMAITKGPTDPTATVEFTDWGAVEKFGKVIAGMAKPA
jgi:menaquinone-dependent protoporphyrinogen oxidase